MKIFSLLTFSICFSFSLLAQTIEWEKNYGGTGIDRMKAIQQTSDGGYIMGGDSHSDDIDVGGHHQWSTTRDFWIIKTDNQGTIQWEQNYGGSLDDYLKILQETPDGGYIMGGHTDSNDFDVSSNNGNFDIWLVKLDAGGTIQWEQNYGGSSSDYLDNFTVTSDGGYILVGSTYSSNGDISSNQGGEDAWVIKLNAQGVIQWEKTYGGSNDDSFAAVELTPDGGYLFGGASKSDDGDLTSHYGSTSFSDFWLVKTDANGNISWQKNYGGTAGESIRAMDQLANGGYILGGSTYSNGDDVSSNNGEFDYWIVKIDENGNILWDKNYGSGDSETLNNVKEANDGGFIIGGLARASGGDVGGNYNGSLDFWLVKTDPFGNIIWEQNYGGSSPEEFGMLALTDDDGYIVGGETASNNNDVSNFYGVRDFWVFKLSEDSPYTSNHTIISPQQTFDVFPNPSNGLIHINFDLEGEKSIRIYDLGGKLVREKIINENSTTLNLQQIKGVFTIEVISGRVRR